ncbi:ArsR/SmtB family transcription factor [Xanthobacter agilis]|uniref:ArsR family transcriptional regulator n=1 Tax=Xanthobacter agilis TaxID=47492 RepID=A0ABU0LHC1_XANAG|nr:metalloregulator ArsR/SmtB family transcription factor [Xanthobacter agilis]MDQ0506525.1 ArsR family transcriptional regulator [Xanthobacter agilis]
MIDPPFLPAGDDAAPDPAAFTALADRLRALGHPARLAVLHTLARENRCVCGEIVRELPLAQSTVSQHLKVLGEAGLIRSRAEGARTAYCLDHAALAALRAEIHAVFDLLLRQGANEPAAES